MSGSKYEFSVAMSCGGCSGAVTRVLNKLEGTYAAVPPCLLYTLTSVGVEKFDVSLETQKVVVETVDASLTYDRVLNAIGKTGKKVSEGYEFVGSEKVSRPVVLA